MTTPVQSEPEPEVQIVEAPEVIHIKTKYRRKLIYVDSKEECKLKMPAGKILRSRKSKKQRKLLFKSILDEIDLTKAKAKAKAKTW